MASSVSIVGTDCALAAALVSPAQTIQAQRLALRKIGLIIGW
jgi:hypothetical protein